MRIPLIVVFLAATVLSAGSSGAQTLRDADAPAEFPPSSYSGKQYVDSRGCVYIRAGIDGNVTWVPRVARSRKLVCGYRPTFAKAQPVEAAPAPAPRRTAAAKAASGGATMGVTAVVPPRAASAAAPTAARRPAPAPVARIPRPAAPRKIVVAKPRVAAPAQPVGKVVVAKTPAARATVMVQNPRTGVTRPAQPACQHGTPVSTRYSGVQSERLPVRCGPQKESPTGLVTRATPAGAVVAVKRPAAVITPTTRVVPRHVYEQQLAARGTGAVPKGYRRAWSDGRLNPHRAHQTPAGRAQMDLIWTREVPRRLVDRTTGRDVTAQFPNIEYPYRGEKVETPVVSTAGKRAAPRAVGAVAGARYVQVATFGVPANAQRTAARMSQMGLPTRMGRLTKGGKSFQVVLAGPFTQPAQVASALAAARRAGFKDAFARR